jgi:hypothetical protein
MPLILLKENGHTGPRLQCDKCGLIAKEPWDESRVRLFTL